MPRESHLYLRWSDEIRRAGLVRAGDRLGVAVSGGPDSVLLLHFMQQLSREMGLFVAVVHFNHHLRGSESDADEGFVRQKATDLGLEFIKGEAQVADISRERHANLEAAGRELRYRFFFSLVNQGRLDKLATAHTANDQAETVLLKLLRGTGTRGLGGIYPALEGKIVRPFLGLTRAEVRAELGRRKLEFRLDSTNLDPKLRRNKVRMELVPLLEKEYNPKVVDLLKDLADRARDDENYLEKQAGEQARPWRVRDGMEEKIPISALVEFPASIARRVLRQMMASVAGSTRGLTYAHIESLRRFAAEAQSGRRLDLPGELVARKEFDWLTLGPQAPVARHSDFRLAVNVPGEVVVPATGAKLVFKIVEPKELPEAYNAGAGLDPRKLRGRLVLRNWRAGDRFQPLGSRKVRKLKELLGGRRVPLGQRKFWPVLEDEKEIVWVRGFPSASGVAATPDSAQILIIEEKTGGRG